MDLCLSIKRSVVSFAFLLHPPKPDCIIKVNFKYTN